MKNAIYDKIYFAISKLHVSLYLLPKISKYLNKARILYLEFDGLCHRE